MEIGAVGIPRRRNLFCGNSAVRFGNLADGNINSGASVRILGKLCREISYMAVKYVVHVDMEHRILVYLQETTRRRWSTA